MTYFGTFSSSKGSHSFLFKSKFILYYWKPGTQACQTSKVLSILHGVRFNLATEKSNRDGAPESRAIKVVRDVFTRTGFSFRPPRLRYPSGACQATLQGKAGRCCLEISSMSARTPLGTAVARLYGNSRDVSSGFIQACCF